MREVLWLLLVEKLLLARRLPLTLTRGRFEGMTARESGGGGGGTREGYEYILTPQTHTEDELKHHAMAA